MLLGSVTEIEDHAIQAEGKLLSRYKGKPRFGAFLDSLTAQVQLFEDAVWDVIRSRFLDLADEVRLNRLGILVGQLRRGETLDEYRLYIQARILVNRSSATAPELLALVELLLSGAAVEYWEYSPASFRIIVTSPIDASDHPEIVAEMLRQAKAAGVGMALEWSTYAGDVTFTIGNIGDAFDPSLGFGSTTEDTGGRLRTVIR